MTLSTSRLFDLVRLATGPDAPLRWTVRRSPRATVVVVRSRAGPASSARPWRRLAHARRQGLVLGAVTGALAAYVLDPELGRRRRDQLAARVRHSRYRLARTGRARALQSVGQARGALHRLHPGKPEQLDDAGLAHKVETVLFRDTTVPKGSISINAEGGKVFLRGQVERAEQIGHAAEVTAGIPGVDEVVNLLHLPGTAAPHPEDQAKVG
jgi:hypothetical protein